MTITAAIDQLAALWPTDSFSVDCEVWSHYSFGQRDIPAVKWTIYSAARKFHYTGGTLVDAVKLAIGAGELAEADAATKPVA